MSKQKRNGLFGLLALMLVLVMLLGLAACGKDPETTPPATDPAPTDPHVHAYTDGLCACGESNGFTGITVATDAGLTAVERLDGDTQFTLNSTNAAGQSSAIRLELAYDAIYGHYYEAVYKFTSNVAGTVRFVTEGAVFYETDTYEVAAGENELVIRFAAGKAGSLTASLELGGLEPFALTFTQASVTKLEADLGKFFLDVAQDATGKMKTTPEGSLEATFQANEGWRVKLAVDRTLVKGKTYETTFVFTREGGKDQNVTYTVYDNAATTLGAKTKWVDQDVCIATFYITANENVTKGTCLELGALSGGEDVKLTVTYVDFLEVGAEKLAQIQAANPFPGVNVWTEGSLTPATGAQSAQGLTLTNPNGATDWWKVKLEKTLDATKGKYYRLTFAFTSDTAGKIKFINDDATYYGSNEFNIVEGENEISVEIRSGGNSYSCLELGNLGKSQLVFTKIEMTEIEKPSQEIFDPNAAPTNRFGSFRVWAEGSLKMPSRSDTETTMTVVSKNAATDWWKVKVEKDLSCKAGKTYSLTYSFTSDTAGRIKFVNDGATYFTSNEYDVKVGKNTFTVEFKSGGNSYSCLELGGLGACKLVFTSYRLKAIEEPEVITNGFESYKAWTEGSMTALDREDTETSMILTSTNAPADWWKVKLENNFATVSGKTYIATYTFTSDAAGDIKFGGDNMTCHTPDVYAVAAGENTFSVTFTIHADNAYNCLELGGLGQFRLEFTSITLTETDPPEVPPEHEHSFVNGACSCGETNGFEGFKVWNEGALTPIVREDSENTMTMTSDNEAADWWKVKLENNFATVSGKTYTATYTFTSDAEGDIKFGGDNMTCATADVYHVVAGDNTFAVTFTVSADNAYNCLELGGLGKFTLVFSSITLVEGEPELPPEHEHSFVNGACSCGDTNGFEGFKTWNEGALNAIVREDTENTMTLTSDNEAADWWKVKLENNFATVSGKTYTATYTFTSDAEGDIKFGGDNMTCATADVYHVVAGDNTFAVTFTVSADNAYNCLELGGLGKFTLVFSSITLVEGEPELPPEHEHSFVNGACSCGDTNGFEGFKVWNEGALTPIVREDSETTMTLTSDNEAADWWKVKLENNFATVSGKTYDVVYTFTSDAEGDIKFGGDNMTCATADVYHVVVGENTFAVTFTVSADNAYNCLELGGLGKFQLVFASITLAEHTHSFVSGSCTCGAVNGFEGFKTWNEGALTPIVREDSETTMTLTSTNAGGDWWKVKLENNFATVSGKTYTATYTFTSNVEGDIKFGGDNMTCATADVYHVVVGENTFAVTFTVSADNAYNCLEMGGLGNFVLTFTGITLQEVA